MADRLAWLARSFVPILALAAPAFEATALAQASEAQPEAHAEEDKTGTNPTKFVRTLILLDEFRSLGEEKGYDEFLFRYIQPVGKVKLQLSLPLDATDRTGTSQFGFGDVGLKANYLPMLTPKFGLVLNLETFWPTATKDAFTTGKYVAAPGATLAFFFRGGAMIFAPSLQQKFSYAGEADRADVNQTQVDLYFVWRPTKLSWLTVDPQIVHDWEFDSQAAQLEIEYGRMLFGGASTYLRPGVGIGADRPLDWNVEVGLKIVH